MIDSTTGVTKCAMIIITTVCDRKCPNCCYATVCKEPRHFSCDELERAAEHYNKFDTLIISGGEATLHPEFKRISRSFRDLFKVRWMELQSNGSQVLEHRDVMGCYDRIRVTCFDKNVLRKVGVLHRMGYNVMRLPDASKHRPLRVVPGNDQPCYRQRFPAYFNGRVYRCCQGPGINGGSVPLSPSWREEILESPLHCENCLFAGKIRGVT
jgi:hypothetical protein